MQRWQRSQCQRHLSGWRLSGKKARSSSQEGGWVGLGGCGQNNVKKQMISSCSTYHKLLRRVSTLVLVYLVKRMRVTKKPCVLVVIAFPVLRYLTAPCVTLMGKSRHLEACAVAAFASCRLRPLQLQQLTLVRGNVKRQPNMCFHLRHTILILINRVVSPVVIHFYCLPRRGCCVTIVSLRSLCRRRHHVPCS